MGDYFDWNEQRVPKRQPARVSERPRPPAAAIEEPLEVQEHHASTTIIERIRGVIRDRLRGE